MFFTNNTNLFVLICAFLFVKFVFKYYTQSSVKISKICGSTFFQLDKDHSCIRGNKIKITYL